MLVAACHTKEHNGMGGDKWGSAAKDVVVVVVVVVLEVVVVPLSLLQ